MEAWFLSGGGVDLVLLVLAIEFAVLLARAPAGQRSAHAWTLVLALAPGAFLLLALRAALSGADWTWIALCIAASFPFHLLDLRRRTF
ncbi:MAG: hypothetical protein GC189_02995 [Alphaproteobacteria bacterium]|nr:hypothetical protein [Alphaproteobacteria bacterium]